MLFVPIKEALFFGCQLFFAFAHILKPPVCICASGVIIAIQKNKRLYKHYDIFSKYASFQGRFWKHSDIITRKQQSTCWSLFRNQQVLVILYSFHYNESILEGAAKRQYIKAIAHGKTL